jgi:hypothetical protein
MVRPVERKVYASTIGAGAGITISNFALWGADALWWPGDAIVPTPVADFVVLVVTIGLTFLGGYFAKHDPGYTEIDQEEEVAELLPDV